MLQNALVQILGPLVKVIQKVMVPAPIPTPTIIS